MLLFNEISNFILNLDEIIINIVQNLGSWSYLLLFFIIFAETGLVIFPFLPGDSLLFILGTLSATSNLNVGILFITLTFAAILGDSVNYYIGRFFGKRIMSNTHMRIFKQEHFEKANAFFNKHGGKTIVLARFIPFLRTFSPFIAGVAHMPYSNFIKYSILGGFIWIFSFLFTGYLFGNVPVVKDNLSIFLLTIIFISILPSLISYVKHKLNKK